MGPLVALISARGRKGQQQSGSLCLRYGNINNRKAALRALITAAGVADEDGLFSL